MTKFEKKILDLADLHLPLLLAALCTLLGIVVRISLREVASGDYRYFLLPWYNLISANGLSQQVGDYNFLYQFIIWILTKIQIPSLYAYKICSCIFDWVLAITAGVIVRRISTQERERMGRVPCILRGAAVSYRFSELGGMGTMRCDLQCFCIAGYPVFGEKTVYQGDVLFGSQLCI